MTSEKSFLQKVLDDASDDHEHRVRLAPIFWVVSEDQDEIQQSASDTIVRTPDAFYVYKSHVYEYRGDTRNAKDLVKFYHWARLDIRIWLLERADELSVRAVDQLICGLPNEFIPNLALEIQECISSYDKWELPAPHNPLSVLFRNYFLNLVKQAQIQDREKEVALIISRAKSVFKIDLETN